MFLAKRAFSELAKNAYKTLPIKLIKEKLPESLLSKLAKDLTDKQLRTVFKLHNLKFQIPQHMIHTDPLTIIPQKGAHPALSVALRKKGGRNNTGKITVRHRGGGFKRRIRLVDTKRLQDETLKVIRLEHDPCRSAKIALVQGVDSKKLRYILAWDGCKDGDLIWPRKNDRNQPGLTLPLEDIIVGTQIHNIETVLGEGGKLAKSAGCKAVLVGKDGDSCSVKMPSSKIVRFSSKCRATIGAVSNPEWHLRVIGKAGRNRNLGWRPTVRGVAMNPVDHPHGGGKGGRSKGTHSQSPWGKICK